MTAAIAKFLGHLNILPKDLAGIVAGYMCLTRNDHLICFLVTQDEPSIKVCHRGAFEELDEHFIINFCGFDVASWYRRDLAERLQNIKHMTYRAYAKLPMRDEISFDIDFRYLSFIMVPISMYFTNFLAENLIVSYDFISTISLNNPSLAKKMYALWMPPEKYIDREKC